MGIWKSVEDTLKELITDYVANKLVADDYKKIADKQNKEIKSLMLESNTDSIETDEWKATCTVSERETINEEMLLDIIHKNVSDDLGIVKTKEYVDFDALEHAIYNDKISKEVLMEIDKARESKEVVTLRVKKRG